MSYFYLKPAKGDMPIHILEEIILKRLEYLKVLSRGDSPLYNEYVIEGSVHDNVGHFVLCILSALAKSTEFTQFFLTAEVMLFRQRIFTLSAYDLRCFAKKLLHSIRKLDSVSVTEPLLTLCTCLSSKSIASHICSPTHDDDCAYYNIKVYFTHCLSFVAQRQVEVCKGIATIPCGKWKKYLVSLFKSSLLLRISQSKQYLYEKDPRMIEILLIVKKIFPIEKGSDMTILRSKEVDKSVQYFPPCMLHLHQHLRKTHRLSHDQRFYYSLFLKDIGMPVEEAIDFWKAEYCQVPTGRHKCTHHWAKDEKKFVYGIKHMYGLEGGRKQYSSLNCTRIQNMESCHEGGCPFKSFDNENMLPTLQLQKYSEPLLSQIFNFKEKKQYTSACLLFLQNHLKTEINCDNMTINFSPVKYFTLAYEN